MLSLRDKVIISVIGFTIGSLAYRVTHADTLTANLPVYTKAPGQPMDATRAILDAASGEKVYKCELVEAKVSKSGTSVSLRKRKKQITAEEAAQKIEEIKKQVGE